ncbi:MAG: uroporphyrinogen decarboxylase family protein [Planctomycetota bacterium]
MNHRERLVNALNHREGPVPVDFGSTTVTGVHVSSVAALREHYGLERKPVKVIEPYQMLGEVEADLLDAIGADAVGVAPPATLFGFTNTGWQPWRTPWGQEVLVPEGFRTTPADGGGLVIYPAGDTDAPPSGHMPDGGYFFDTIIRQPPLDDDHLNVEDNLEEFGPVDDATLEHLKTETAAARAGGRAVVMIVGGTALGDIALVPAPFLKHPKGIRDVAEWYMSTAMRPDYVKAIFARQVELARENLPKIHDAVGDRVDVAFLCGTDFGTQTSTFCSPATFDDLYAPYYTAMNDWIHANTPWKTFKHSCGAVEPFIGRLADAGFDILNPVQCSAAGMDPQTLKDRYGDRIVFWGGGVDTQHTLPFDTPDAVREQVLQRCRIFSRGGGFVFNAIHNVQARTPVANMVAMIEAVKEFNRKG